MKDWYAIQTHSGYETKARDALRRRFALSSLEGALGEILIPSEPVAEPSLGGSGVRVEPRRTFPGYLFAELEMSGPVFHLVKGTPHVVRLVGDRAPQRAPRAEIEDVRRRTQEGKLTPTPRTTFASGDLVEVREGPFAGFTGPVDAVAPERPKLEVRISIFGRSAVIPLDRTAVEKLGHGPWRDLGTRRAPPNRSSTRYHFR